MSRLLDIRIDNLSKEDILQKINSFLSGRKFYHIATINPEIILEAQKNIKFKNILNSCDLNVADGIGLKFAFLRFRNKLKHRLTGADLMTEILRIANENDLSIFLVANKDGLSSWKETHDAILKLYPNLKIAGNNIDKKTTNCGLRIASYDIIFCNFGAPFQEILLSSLKSQKDSKIKIAMGVGGGFDFITDKIKRAPKLIRKLGLEWSWRLFKQPQRWKRILRATILFPVKIIMDKKTNKIRVRFAPSPTGYLHVGGLKTALFDYLIAKKLGGDFILRIEDTDQKRYVKGTVEALIKSLKWTGLFYNEGPIIKSEVKSLKSKIVNSKNYPGIEEIGEYGPYIQSERLELYKKYADKLVADGKAYYCFCSNERLEKLRESQAKNKEAPKYDRQCLNLSREEIKKKISDGEKYVIRFKIPEGKTEFKDLVYGNIQVENYTLDDQVLLKSDGFPTYHLAVVVDDYLMKISHVVRGAEWLPSTPKHVLLYHAFGWEDNIPDFVHMPNMLNKDKKKLSKRHDSVSVEEFRQMGFPQEAILNYILLLGWNPKTTQEIFTIDEMVEQFDIAKINRAGGIFDVERLAWISSQHIKKMNLDELYKRSLLFLEQKEFYQKAETEKKSEKYIKKIITIEQDRLSKFTEIGESNKFFFQDIHCDKNLLIWKDMSEEDLKKSLEKSKNILENISETEWSKENLEKILLEAAGEKRGELLWPLRASLTGEQKSPSPFEVAWVLGKEESLKRINNALGKI